MNKYNVGDVIKLRDDLEVGEEYGAVDFLCSMKTLKNKALRIDRIDTEDDECVVYEIDGWYISDEMIEGLWEECKEKQDKLKLIDVLNMIAKGELKEGTKFVYRGNMYIWEDNAILNTTNLDAFDIADRSDLNMELYLIEPPCEHEWKDIETHRMGEGRIRRYRRCNKCGLEEETDKCIPDEGKTSELSKIEELEECEFYTEGAIVAKLNEVIRKINKE